jgi:hypothetical protein
LTLRPPLKTSNIFLEFESILGWISLRLLQTIVEVAAEKNSAVIAPVPVEVLRFLDRQLWRLAGPSGQRGKPGPSRSFKQKPASTRMPADSPRSQLCPSSTSCRTAAGAPHI